MCTIVLAVGLGATAGASKLITGNQIKNGSIGVADLSKSAKRALTGKIGKTGPAGAQGVTGASGPAGAAGLGTIQRVDSPTVTIAPGDSSYEVELSGGPALDAACPAGQVVVGTGFNNSVGSIGFVESFGSLVGGFIYNDSSISIDVKVQAMCAAQTGAVAASRRGSAKARFRREAARAQARFGQ